VKKKDTLAGLGPLFQFAFVAYDVAPLVDHWANVIGAGPFFELKNLKLERTFFRGTPQDVTIDATLGYWGDIQIEFIRPHNDNPSVYSEWLKAGKTGVHHFAVEVGDIHAARRTVDALGLQIAQESLAFNGEPFFYVEADGKLFELLAFDQRIRELFGMMREAHRGWDGSDPLRSV